jgi:hypothetical protein
MVAFLTSALGARRSKDEKFWELRRVAYGSILAELIAVEWVLDTAEEYIAEDACRYFQGDASSRHNELISCHMQLIKIIYRELSNTIRPIFSYD